MSISMSISMSIYEIDTNLYSNSRGIFVEVISLRILENLKSQIVIILRK